MVKLNKIYTKTGDAGTTGLGTGERVAKDASRIAAYGTVDETNSAIGMARIHLGGGHQGLDAKLERIQNDLFDLGADLCVPDRGEPLPYEPLRMSEAQVDRIEAEIDELNSELQPLKSFVLPGGSAAAAACMWREPYAGGPSVRWLLFRACRGVGQSGGSQIYQPVIDFLFVASRYVNDRGRSDVLWVPGQNR